METVNPRIVLATNGAGVAPLFFTRHRTERQHVACS
jgi:hypothetical protein